MRLPKILFLEKYKKRSSLYQNEKGIAELALQSKCDNRKVTYPLGHRPLCKIESSTASADFTRMKFCNFLRIQKIGLCPCRLRGKFAIFAFISVYKNLTYRQ